MDMNEAAERVTTAALRLRSVLAAERVITTARHLADVLGKANFNPGQPRVPAGSREGGRWTGGDESIGQDDSEILAVSPSGERLLMLASGQIEPPHIPKIRPPTGPLRHAVVKEVAKWIALGVRVSPAGRILNLIEAAIWIYEFIPYIEAYRDPPKSLEELQRAARNKSQPGYEDHHVVEQTPARNSGFSEAEISSRQNVLRVPTLKHWEITGWYARPNPRFGLKSPNDPSRGWNSPRDYLRDKDWKERERIGLEALRFFKVLDP